MEILFKKKWGIIPAYSANIRFNMMELADFTKEGLVVLDIGCACGANLMYIKHKKPSDKTYGIRPSDN